MRVHRFVRLVALVAVPTLASGLGFDSATAASPDPGCHLQSVKGDIRHVIAITFDNVHFTRDNPNVPSDLEQMPHLLNFIENDGTLLSNHHTPLISHTADDILTTLTGLYPDLHGVPVANSYRRFKANNSTSTFAGSFAYWTSRVGGPTGPYNMVTTGGKNTPAPWVPFTRAGCNFGAVATANTILESQGEAVRFGLFSAHPTADFVGIGIHCTAGAALCAGANGRDDVLTDEPGGYAGFRALYGHKSVAQSIGPIADLNGNVLPGFPGFDGMSAPVSLGYVAAMQEHGVPVTFAYISDAHDDHAHGLAFGPGQAGYVAQLKQYDDAFAAFFNRLTADGITQANTLFVVTSDENDHFAGGQPTNPGCDGVRVACTYSKIGEIDGNLTEQLGTLGNTQTFQAHADMAPAIYIDGNPSGSDSGTRALERLTAQLVDPSNAITGRPTPLTEGLADRVEQRLLHMVSADPARTPTYIMFANPDYFLCAVDPTFPPGCTVTGFHETPGFAWNHGGFQTEITTTWLGLVGPGVRQLGVDADTWSDHTDVRPTLLSIVGLHDDYAHQGRVLFEDLYDWAVPQTLRAHRETLNRLAQMYKQINAPVGPLSLATLTASTTALRSGAPGSDAAFTQTEEAIATLTTNRDSVAAQMESMLEKAAFGNQAINEQDALSLVDQGQALLDQANALAGGA